MICVHALCGGMVLVRECLYAFISMVASQQPGTWFGTMLCVSIKMIQRNETYRYSAWARYMLPPNA